MRGDGVVPAISTAPPYNHWGNSPVNVVSLEIFANDFDNLKSNANSNMIQIGTTITLVKHRVN